MTIHLYSKDFPVEGVDFKGGLNKAVHGLACGLIAAGIPADVVCNGAESSLLQAPAGYTIRCFKQRLGARVGVSPPGDEIDAYVASCDRSDLFILNGVFNPGVQVMSTVCRRHRIGYACWPHDPYQPPLFAKKSVRKWTYWYTFERSVLRHAKAVLVFDQRHAERLHDLGVETPTIGIVNGVDPADMIAESALRWSGSPAPSVVFLGRFDYYNKALDILLDAFSEVAPFTNAQLTLQGPDGGDLAMLKERATRLGLTDRVKFKRPRYDRSAAEILNDHDVFVLPSRFEGFSLAALEAMVAARAVMVSEINGIAPHVLEAGCGIVVRPEVASVKAGLLELLEVRPRWREMGLAGRDYALRHFSWRQIALDLLDALVKVNVFTADLRSSQPGLIGIEREHPRIAGPDWVRCRSGQSPRNVRE